MNSKKIEQKALIGGIFVNFLMCCAGVLVYNATQIEALFVDAYFSAITLISGVFSLIVSKISARRSKKFPEGFFVLEPLYSLFQSLLTIVLLAVSLIKVSLKAYRYFVYGQGSLMNVEPVIPYEIVMVLLSLGLSYYYSRQNNKINHLSMMLFSEAKGTLVDGLMSLGIGIFAFILFFIKQSSPFGFLRYTGDFFITSLLIMLTIKMPFQVIKRAFNEICGGLLLDQDMQKWIENCLNKHLLEIVSIKSCLIYKIGMSFRIDVFIKGKAKLIDNEKLSRKKVLILKELSKKLEFVHLEFCLC
ncbi:putative Cobalt-zinc-cadmium resistance protein [Oenococcus oeni]|uniref:cation transporter n=1 Tax=Oenococcus oeni TaxID=1247 RepID=UPI0010B3225C|nr:cation transporter [Oenococcus oeni]SYW04428.1 putative Cobalt-zinc-cadmium resistance protein [Oenococcus oeni]